MKLKNKKVLGLFLGFAVALCAVVPGTLAAETATSVTDNSISIGEAADHSVNDEEISVEVETPSDAEEKCTCIINEDGTRTYTEGCPVHEAPAPVEPTVPVEPTTPAHIEGCSDDCTVEGCTCPCHAGGSTAPTAPTTPVKPGGFTHIEGCSDECDGVNCECPCHKLSLFDRLMKCETYVELMEMIEATPEEEIMALTEEQVEQIEEKLLELEPEPLPPVGEEIISIEEEEVPLASEIVYPTVNFDDVAPFGAPVVG